MVTLGPKAQATLTSKAWIQFKLLLLKNWKYNCSSMYPINLRRWGKEGIDTGILLQKVILILLCTKGCKACK
jgi:hypothetical protein